MTRSKGTPAKASYPKVRIKVWLERDGQYVFGFGISRILKAVEATGSIKAGAARLGLSYRYVWGRIKKAEIDLGMALVETRVGGAGTRRSTLTGAATRLMADYDALRQRSLEIMQQEFPIGRET